MNMIDLIIAIPVLWGIYKGYSKGLISEVAQFAALILGILLGTKLSYLFSGFLINTFGLSENLVPIVSFALIFLAVLIGVFLLAKALTNAVKSVSLGWLNRIGGMLLGGLKFLLVLGIILQLVVRNDVNRKILSSETRENSILLSPTLKTAAFFSPYLKKALFDVDMKSNEIDENLNKKQQ